MILSYDNGVDDAGDVENDDMTRLMIMAMIIILLMRMMLMMLWHDA